MTKKIQKSNNDKGFPIDERPIIFNLISSHAVNYLGRYIEGDGIFMLSLNDTQTDFVLKEKVNEWWYINEHPIVVEEVLNQKPVKKEKVKKEKVKKEEKPKYVRKSKDSEKKTDSEPTSETQDFSVPRGKWIQPPIPDFLRNLVSHIQQQTGVHFQGFTMQMVSENNLPNLPKEVLEQLLERAEKDENWDLAIKVRDALKSK